MQRRLSIRIQLLVLVLAVALPAIGLVTYNIIDASNQAREAANSQVRGLATETASKLDLIIQEDNAVLARIAARPAVRLLDPRNLDPIVKDFAQIYPEVNNLGIRDLDANNIYSFRPNPSSPEEAWGFPWFRDGIQNNSFTVGNAFRGRLSKRWVFVMTYPIRDDSGVVSGLINLSIDLLQLQEQVMRVVPEDAVIAVVDREGKVLMRSINPAEWIGNPLPAPEAGQIRGLNNGLFRSTGVDRIARLYAVATVSSSGWRVIAGLPEAKVFAQIQEQVARSAVIGIAVLLLVLLLAYRISAGIARPISDLARAALDGAGGGATHTQIKGAAEVEAVAHQIDRLIDERAAVAAHYEQLVKLARDIFVLLDPFGNIIDINDAAVTAYGYSADELRGKNVRDLRTPEAQATLEQDWRASSHPGGALFETVHRRKDGSTFPVEVSARVIEINGESYQQNFIRDVTERKLAIAVLGRQKDLYNTLSQTNQAIVRCASRDELFQEICRIAVECGHFCFAAVRLVGPDDTRVQIAAQHGDDSGYLDEVEVSTSPDEDIGRGPTGRAIRTGNRVIANDFVNDPSTVPWREAAQRAGVRASGAFPLRLNGAVVGAIDLYSAESGFFTEEILPTLDEMAVDVSFALDNFKRDTEQRRAEEQAKIYLTQIEQSMLGTIDAVSAMVEMRDPYTSGHERRVSKIAAAIASEMGLPESEIKGLRIAGLLHDIGKIACPAEILSKPSRLTAIEYELVKSHPQLGYDILQSVQFPWPIAQIVLQHHERLDGSGYPQRLKGDAIVLPARILAVADTIEAMASHRPYRPGLGIEAALQEVEDQSGKLYDPQVVSACLRLFREKNYRLPD